MKRKLIYFLGTFFFSGSAPRARGTIGTAVPALMIWLVDMHLHWPWWWTLLAAGIVLILGTPLASAASTKEDPDPSWFVVDEVAGMLITIAGQVALTGAPLNVAILVAFITFRGFDIIKPQPIGWVDKKIKGGIGVMLDDVLAAVYAWILTYAILYVYML